VKDQEELGHEWSCQGTYVEAMADTYDISSKELSAESGVHPSILSRFFTGKQAIKDRQLVRIGVALGRLAEQRDKKRTQTTRV
jgi:hypothetical protein